MCTALVVGNTIGVGIFMLPASLAPYGLNAMPAWLITAAGCMFVAWVFAGLARTFPDDDGPYCLRRPCLWQRRRLQCHVVLLGHPPG